MADEKNNPAAGDNELKEYKIVDIEEEKKRQKKARIKKIFKIFAWIFAVLIALLVLLVVFRDFLIESGVRHIGTLVTGTEVRIASFKSSFTGSVELKDIKVANPPGYQKPYAFEIGRIYIKVDTSTLTSDEPVVETVEVTGVSVDMEVKSSSRSNISDIQANVEKFAGTSDEKNQGEKEPEKKAREDEKTSDPDAPAPLIKKIALTSMGLSVSSSTFKTSVPIPIAPVYLENIGGKGNPLGETLLTVFRKFLGAVNAVGGTLIGGVETIGNAGKVLGEGIAEGTKSLGNAGKNIGTNLSDSAKSVTKGITDIFKKKK